MPEWYAAQETANLTDIFIAGTTTPIVMPPAPATGFAFMGAGIVPAFIAYSFSEGIAQKIPELAANQKYCLSFFMKRGYPFTIPLPPITTNVKLKIILMNCSDYNSINVIGGLSPAPTPAIPTNSQIIYSHTGFNNYQTWEQKMISFTANSNFNMVWIYPETVDLNPSADPPSICFAYPELINIQNFNAGPTPSPNSPLCLTTIGPIVPNCSVANAVFRWKGPAGQTITPSATQQISIDASVASNRGTWTLSMTSPITVNNTGNVANSQLPNVTSTVIVPTCQTPCISLPLIQ